MPPCTIPARKPPRCTKGGTTRESTNARQVLVRLAQTHAAQRDFTQLEFLADQLIQIDDARDNVAPELAGEKSCARLSIEVAHLFALDQRDFVIRVLRHERKLSFACEITITIDALACNERRLCNRLHFTACLIGNVNTVAPACHLRIGRITALFSRRQCDDP